MITRIQQICGKQNHSFKCGSCRTSLSTNEWKLFYTLFLKSSQFCLEWLSSLENVALSPVTVLKWLAVDPVHRNPRKVLFVWLVVSELICCWNCPCCFRLQFETADDEDFIAVQNAIDEVISELKILPGFSSLEEVRVNAVTLMGEFGWWYVDRNQ